MKLEKKPCPCGCKKFLVPGLIGCQCGSLDKETASELVRRWNAFERGGEFDKLRETFLTEGFESGRRAAINFIRKVR